VRKYNHKNNHPTQHEIDRCQAARGNGAILSDWFKNIMVYGEDDGALLFIRNHQIESEVQKSLNPTKKACRRRELMLPKSLMDISLWLSVNLDMKFQG
jgi:hypothetical protein